MTKHFFCAIFLFVLNKSKSSPKIRGDSMSKKKTSSVVHVHLPASTHKFLKMQAVFLGIRLGSHIETILGAYQKTFGNDCIDGLNGKSSPKKSRGIQQTFY